LETFSKEEESGYYYYSSFPVSCWLSGPFSYWLIVCNNTHRQTLFFFSKASNQAMNMSKRNRKREDFFFLFLPTLTIMLKLEEADD
jgi:hypothetical protein